MALMASSWGRGGSYPGIALAIDRYEIVALSTTKQETAETMLRASFRLRTRSIATRRLLLIPMLI